MNIFIEEIGTRPNSTASQLFINGNPFCFVIEDGHRDNKVPGETRIPPGRYQVIKSQFGRFATQYNLKYQHLFVPLLKDVPGFKDILIHIGNTNKDTRGCLLVNYTVTLKNGEYEGMDSTRAYLQLYAYIAAAFSKKEEVWVEISRREIINENVAG